MKTAIALALLGATFVAHAEEYVCTPQAISGVAQVDGRYITTDVKTEGSVFYTGNEAGHWSVKMAGYNTPFVTACSSAAFCQSKAGWFARDIAKGTFVAQWNSEVSQGGGPEVVAFLVAGGVCQRI